MMFPELIKKVLGKLKRVFLFPARCIESISTVREIEKLKGNDIDSVIVLLKGIGDTVYGLAYIDEIMKKTTNIAVIGNIKLKSLIESYSKNIKFIPYDVSKGQYKRFSNYMECERIIKVKTSFNLYNTDPYHVYMRCKGANYNSAINLLRMEVFKLEENSKITYPPIAKTPVKAIKNFKELATRLIILNPYSNSVNSVKLEIYEKIANSLKNSGFIVYTNTTEKQKEILGTEKLVCSIDELASILQSVAGIVSLRSGILDLAVNSGTPMFVIYSNCTKKFQEIYSLSAWVGKSTVEEVFYDQMSEKDFFDRFDKWIAFLSSTGK